MSSLSWPVTKIAERIFRDRLHNEKDKLINYRVELGYRRKNRAKPPRLVTMVIVGSAQGKTVTLFGPRVQGDAERRELPHTNP